MLSHRENVRASKFWRKSKEKKRNVFENLPRTYKDLIQVKKNSKLFHACVPLRMDNYNTFPRGLAYHIAHVCLGGEGGGAAQTRLQGTGAPGSLPGQGFQTQEVQVKPSVSTEQSPEKGRLMTNFLKGLYHEIYKLWTRNILHSFFSF
jgi:hypothetical protein